MLIHLSFVIDRKYVHQQARWHQFQNHWSSCVPTMEHWRDFMKRCQTQIWRYGIGVALNCCRSWINFTYAISTACRNLWQIYFLFWLWQCLLKEKGYVLFLVHFNNCACVICYHSCFFEHLQLLHLFYGYYQFYWFLQESLKYRLVGSQGEIGSWGHEYVR